MSAIKTMKSVIDHAMSVLDPNCEAYAILNNGITNPVTKDAPALEAVPDSEFERLLTEFGNLQFDCGAWDDDNTDRTEHASYIALVEKSRAARAALRLAASHPQPAKQEAAPLAAVPEAARDVLAERQRQKDVEGWTAEHDDEHEDFSLAQAAATYAIAAASNNADRSVMDTFGNGGITAALRRLWPNTWDAHWLKPKSRRADLIKAGALILAEIERLDRLATKQSPAATTNAKEST